MLATVREIELSKATEHRDYIKQREGRTASPSFSREKSKSLVTEYACHVRCDISKEAIQIF